MKHSRDKTEEPVYESILMPRNSPLAIVIAGFSFLAGFGLIWHIYWLALIGLLGVISTVIYRSTDENTEYRISAATVRKIEQARTV
jgi:cytochrome o ubiquinol oxidase subunit I